MLNRDDVASWIEGLANGGKLYATVGTDLPDGAAGRVFSEGRRGPDPSEPGRSVGLPRTVAKPVRERSRDVDSRRGRPFLRSDGELSGGSGVPGVGCSMDCGAARCSRLKSKNLEVGSGTLKIDESIVATRRGVTRRTTVTPHDPDRRRDDACVRPFSSRAGGRAFGRWRGVGGQRPHRCDSCGAAGAAPFVRPSARTLRRKRRAASAHVAWSAPHSGDSATHLGLALNPRANMRSRRVNLFVVPSDSAQGEATMGGRSKLSSRRFGSKRAIG